VRKELLEMLRVIHYQLIDNGFVKINTGEFVRVAFNNHSSHGSEVFGNRDRASFHDENVL
jgi:hypothetical protein